MQTMTIRPLDSDELARVALATTWINEILERRFRGDMRLTGTKEDIPIMHSLLDRVPFGTDATAELINFGTVFGEILKTEIPTKWVVYQDEHGTDFALQYEDLDIYLFPLDLIVKRVEQGTDPNEINLRELLEDIRANVEDLAKELRS